MEHFTRREDAGVVDEQVNLAILIDDCLDNRLDLFVVGNIQCYFFSIWMVEALDRGRRTGCGVDDKASLQQPFATRCYRQNTEEGE